MKKAESKKIRAVLDKALSDAINTLKSDNPLATIANLNVQVSQSKRSLLICDDEKRIIGNMYLDEELPNTDMFDFFYANLPRFFKEVAVNCRNRKLFDGLNILMPFSLIVTDEEGNTLLDYVLLTDDNVAGEEVLMKDLDKDLNLFLKNLLSDLE